MSNNDQDMQLPDLKQGLGGMVAGDREKVAVGAVLLEMSGRDGDYAPEEVKKIFSMMCNAYSMSKEQVHGLLGIADKERVKKTMEDFISTINNFYDNNQKVRILAMVWAVLFADQEFDRFEEKFAEQMKNRLRLSADEMVQARAMVSSGLI